MVKWTRTYAAVPLTHNEWETIVYKFVGLFGSYYINQTWNGLTTAGSPGRLPWSRRVKTRVQHDYYLVDPAGTLAADGSGTAGTGHPNYTQAGSVPYNLAMVYCALTTGEYVPSVAAATLSGTMTMPWYNTVATGNAWEYANMLADARSNGWNATPTSIVLQSDGSVMNTAASNNLSTWGGQLPVEDSLIERWKGNIFRRITRYVLAA